MRFTGSLCLFAVLAGSAPLATQCSNVWLTGNGLPGTSGTISAITTWDPDGAGPAPALLIAAGNFTMAGSALANFIAARDPATGIWSPLGTGVNNPVNALATLPNGDLVAGGLFTTAGGVPANRIARWNGVAWSPLGTGMNSTVRALMTLPNGDLIAGGDFTHVGGVTAYCIARWDGVQWSAVGTGLGGGAYALAGLPNGDLVAGGAFPTAGGVTATNIARWDGVQWSALGTGVIGAVLTLAPLPNGDLVAGGLFATAGGTSASRIARWDGAVWSPLGAGLNSTVLAVTALPNGELVAGGFFTMAGGMSANRIARWNGSAWSALGTGMNSEVRTLTTAPNGDVVVGGDFTTVDGAVSAYLARLSTTCPATAVSFGAGCASSGGSNTLTATSLPWVDAVFRSQATGLPNSALVVAVTSFDSIAQGIAPLANVLPPQGMPGCDLLVQPHILQLVSAASGTAQFAVLLLNTPPVVGASFYHQMVPFELDAQGNLIAITSTNALQLTAGAF